MNGNKHLFALLEWKQMWERFGERYLQKVPRIFPREKIQIARQLLTETPKHVLSRLAIHSHEPCLRAKLVKRRGFYGAAVIPHLESMVAMRREAEKLANPSTEARSALQQSMRQLIRFEHCGYFSCVATAENHVASFTSTSPGHEHVLTTGKLSRPSNCSSEPHALEMNLKEYVPLIPL